MVINSTLNSGLASIHPLTEQQISLDLTVWVNLHLLFSQNALLLL